jgi:protein required for attachment to host cells
MDQVRLEHDIWVVVADGEKALFLRNEGDSEYPNLQVMREMNEENPRTNGEGDEKPGRNFDGANGNKSAFEESDWHRMGKERFADDIAEKLYLLAHRGKFQKIVLVAPPVVLGEMRKVLHKEVSERVVGEVPKTLTNHPVPEIERILAGQSSLQT